MAPLIQVLCDVWSSRAGALDVSTVRSAWSLRRAVSVSANSLRLPIDWLCSLLCFQTLVQALLPQIWWANPVIYSGTRPHRSVRIGLQLALCSDCVHRVSAHSLKCLTFGLTGADDRLCRCSRRYGSARCFCGPVFTTCPPFSCVMSACKRRPSRRVDGCKFQSLQSKRDGSKQFVGLRTNYVK